MAHPKLDNLVKVDLLRTEAAARDEFDGLVASGLARLGDAKNASNSLDGRFDLAYNAAHALSLAALRWHGYRPNNKRYVVFQALEHTLGLPAKQWRVLAEAHERRNRTEYEGAVGVEPELLAALVRVVDEVADSVRALDPP